MELIYPIVMIPSEGYTKSMFGLSLGHILILLVVILLFGAKRLPELGGALGKGLRSFKKGLDGKDDDDPKIESDKQG